MYRHVLTFNFSDDETRLSFEELMEDMGFKQAEDQSTYVLDLEVDLPSLIVKQQVIRWSQSRNVYIEKEDFVQLFYSTAISSEEGRRVPAIGARLLTYDEETEGLK